MSNFSDFWKKILKEDGFKDWFVSYLNQVIKYELLTIYNNEVIPEVRPFAITKNEVSFLYCNLKIMPILLYFKYRCTFKITTLLILNMIAIRSNISSIF